jgi:hypothetical protein
MNTSDHTISLTPIPPTSERVHKFLLIFPAWEGRSVIYVGIFIAS